MLQEMVEVAYHILLADFLTNLAWKPKLSLQCVRRCSKERQSLLLKVCDRWDAVLCNDRPRAEGPSNDRPEEAAAGRFCLGGCDAWDV